MRPITAIPLFLLLACGSPAQPLPVHAAEAAEPVPSTAPPHVPLARLLDSLRVDPSALHLLVVKSERRLSVMHDSIELRRYPIVLGLVPEGDKHMEGDRRTPEGDFTFRDKYPHRQWHRFVWIDYPNAESRARFQRRKREGVIPANATIGGEIGIHGVPEGMDHWIDGGEDWTFGCIAMRNSDLDEVYALVSVRSTLLRIVP